LDLVLSCIALLIPLGIAVAVLPGLVNGVAYLTGAENSSVFLPCHTPAMRTRRLQHRD
jgi:hypothetical protein